MLDRLPILAVAALLVSGSPTEGWTQNDTVSAATDEPFIQLRLAREAQAPGYRLMEMVTTPDTVYVAERNIVTDDDVLTAEPNVTKQGVVLNIVLSEEGAHRLEETTGAEIGNRLAVLVESQLVSAPVILESIDAQPGLHISLELPHEDAEAIAETAAERWPMDPKDPSEDV